MKNVVLCCKRLGTKCPSAKIVGGEVHLSIPKEDLPQYVEDLEDGGIKIKLQLEQVDIIEEVVEGWLNE